MHTNTLLMMYLVHTHQNYLQSSSSPFSHIFPPLSMEEDEPAPKKTKTVRHKCSACYKMYNKKEHLVEHMKVSYHSVHQPKCGVCKKHCKTFESLREHLVGPLCKSSCAKTFLTQGCNLCMKIFDSSDALSAHTEICHLSRTIPLGPSIIPLMESKLVISNLSEPGQVPESIAIDCEIVGGGSDGTLDLCASVKERLLQGPDIVPRLESKPVDSRLSEAGQVPEAIAIDCEIVGGGSDGTLDLCASVCVIDEDENVLLHKYVQPIIPVTNYRYDITGLTEDHMKDAMPLGKVQDRILEILQNGESISRLRMEGGKARFLVGHNLEKDLECLRIFYPDHMLRDTSKYHPLMKTNSASHSLKYLTRTYLGYEIQTGVHDTYEDSVAAMRLYKRMCSQEHPSEESTTQIVSRKSTPSYTIFDSMHPTELEEMSPDELLKISRPNYRCWCLDAKPNSQQ